MGATRTRHVDEKAEGSRRASCPPVCVSTRRTRLEPGFLRVARAPTAPRSEEHHGCRLLPSLVLQPCSCHSPRRASQPKTQRGGWGGGRAPKNSHTWKSRRRHCSLALRQPQPARSPPAHPKPAPFVSCGSVFCNSHGRVNERSIGVPHSKK